MFKKTNCLNCQGGGSYSSPMQKSIWDFGGRMLVCKNGKIKSEDDLLLACPKKKGKKWQQYILSFRRYVWLKSPPLKDSFPMQFKFSEDKNKVSELGSWADMVTKVA